MFRKPDFKLVLTDLVDPILKLRVACGRFDIESGNISLEIYYDPALESDRLTMPMPPTLARIWARHNKGAAPEVAFESNDCRQITSIILELKLERYEVFLKIRSGNHGFSYKSKLIEQCGNPSFAGYGYDIILSVIRAAVILPEWKSIYKSAGKVSLFLDRSLAYELARSGTFAFDDDVEGDILVAERAECT